MRNLIKTLLAVSLGLGFMALDAHAKPSVAFLGLLPESDPQVVSEIARRIQLDLSADTGLFVFPQEEVDLLYAKGVLAGPQMGPLDGPKLGKALGANYYAFAKLEPISVASTRKWYTPWAVKVKWSQGLRLRVLDGATGMPVCDSLVAGNIEEKSWVFGPEEDWGRIPPLERDAYLKKEAALLSVEAAKALSKAVKDRTGGNAAVTPDAGKPAGG